MASERFSTRIGELAVAHDVRVVGDFISIFCDGHHRDRDRGPAATDAAALGVYGRKVPTLCEECAAHLAYAEKRRAYCGKDPKPFCAHCDTQCYSPAELEWQRGMMRYSGPRSVFRGHALDGIKHALEARRYRRLAAQGGSAPGATGISADEEKS